MPERPDIKNRFVQRAVLYNQQTDAQARRLAEATAQPPANAHDLAGKHDELSRAWNYSPSPNPAQDFWAMHDQTLQQTMGQLTPDAPPEVITAAHNQAETAALNAVYPYRAELIGVGTRVLDDQVAQAERIKRIVEGRAENEMPQTAQHTNLVDTPAAHPMMPRGSM